MQHPTPYTDDMRFLVGKIADMATRLQRVMHQSDKYTDAAAVLDGIGQMTGLLWHATTGQDNNEEFKQTLGVRLYRYREAMRSLDYAEEADHLFSEPKKFVSPVFQEGTT